MTHNTARISLLLTSIMMIAVCFCLTSQPVRGDEEQRVAGTGVMVGEVTSTSAIIQVRLSKTDKLIDQNLPGVKGVVRFLLKPKRQPNSSPLPQQVAHATAENDFIARVQFKNLTPGKTYACYLDIYPSVGDIVNNPSANLTTQAAEFKTLPSAIKSEPVSFVVVTGMNYAKFHGTTNLHRPDAGTKLSKLPKPYQGDDKHLGYPALEAILKDQPNFFVGTGDNVYYDSPKEPRATTVDQMRLKWHEQFVQPRFKKLFAKVPTYWEIDDHDFRDNDCDNTGDFLPSVADGRRLMFEQLPYGLLDDENVKTYRTHRVNKDLQIWLVENRLYRSPNRMPDGPEKTIWGKEQKAWLKRTLLASDATFKILISPTPMIGPDDAYKTDNHCNLNGFQYERDEFFAWVTKHKLHEQGFYIACGDRHWQYHSIHPSGIEELSCGALVDANARIGKSPGDPKSTDPNSQIKQPYTQTAPSGGYLWVGVAPKTKMAPAKLTIKWKDEHGKVLNSTEK